MSTGHQQFSAQILGTLTHTSNADARAAGARFYDSVGHALSIVTHFNGHRAFVLRQADPRLTGPGMAEDVGEFFLNNTKHRGFQLERETREIRGTYLQRGLDTAALSKPSQIPT